jgi:hypothetical protein
MKHALLAEFEAPEPMLRAIGELRRQGYRHLDAFTPYPVKGLEAALGQRRSPITWLVLPFWVTAAATAYGIQWYCNAFDWPLNVGGKPPHSAPAFIPITFEMGVLGASLAGLILLLVLTGLPELYHPLFEAEGFERATLDRFFVGIDTRDPVFDEPRLRDALAGLGALQITLSGGSIR